MAGHSKWSNIKRKKEKTDAQKGKMFTKLGREIAIAVKEGGPDPNSNSKLKDAIAKAKSNNMPNDTIQRSIKKAAGEGDGSNYEIINYEGYGPSGIAVIVQTYTDNRNRTAGDIRHFFDKFGGNMGTTGCVSFMFNMKGQIIVEKDSSIDEDDFIMKAIEAGAEDIITEDEYYEIITEPGDFSAVCDELEGAGIEFASAEITMLPTTYTRLEDEEAVEKMEKLIDKLEDHDDVQNIWHNWEQD
ncbi:MAG: YebC/PmpR family DNA-binding transcriptional regulator [Acetivibrionales bacterium]|jgi:YebC/PmpR family DNA-binding regulatory protein|nr:YebC/PmpR family DNA-binding transcriptional regulator [Clostridiaceae bacterium]